MPATQGGMPGQAYTAVIYLRGTPGTALDGAERRCRDYAGRFGWHVLDSIRHYGSPALSVLLGKAATSGAQIIVTDTLAMISPDPAERDGLMMEMERAQYIVHPVTASPVHYPA